MSDIVDRLRRNSNTTYGWINRQNIEAANEIESLRTQLAGLAQELATATRKLEEQETYLDSEREHQDFLTGGMNQRDFS